MSKSEIEAQLIVTKHKIDKHLWCIAQLKKELAETYHELLQLCEEKTNDR